LEKQSIKYNILVIDDDPLVLEDAALMYKDMIFLGDFDSRQFNRGVFMNLLKNARDAVIEEKVTQDEGYRGNILVKTELRDKKTVVSVHDNGIGVPEGQEEKILENKYSIKESGTGLGLYTARFILDELGYGKIYCLKSDFSGYTTKLVVESEIEKE
jgi:nitrogen fixation/metabolism regulation signal transduction histidine kinase